MRNDLSDLARSRLLHRVRFIQNQEILGKQKSTLAFHLFLDSAQQHEEQGVINDHDRRVLEFSTGSLIKTAIALPTNFPGADVSFTANLRPNLRVRLKRQIAQRAVTCPGRPRSNLFQLVLFRAGKEIVLLLARTQQPAWTYIILPALDQRGLERFRQNFL